MADKFESIVSLAKRRGFVYPSSEIYGGLRNVYDYGPVGAELVKNIRDLWWRRFVHSREDTVGLESAILMHPKVWEASGHATGFSDLMVEDKKNHERYRADHLIEEWSKKEGKKAPETETMSAKDLDKYIKENKIKSPSGNDLTEVKNFNLMFQTQLGSTDATSTLFLRAETAQGMYVDFKNIINSNRLKLPFGVAQQGRVFRNEITTGKFLFRMLEFQQMEIQYFFDGSNWENQFEEWRREIENWYFEVLGLEKSKFLWKPHANLIFYAKAAEDIQFEFPWGFDEVSGLHYRTNYDLSTHQKHSGEKLHFTDPVSGEKILPHVLETTWGLDRNFFMIIADSYKEEEDRIVLKIKPSLSPYKLAIFPLLSNKEDIINKARDIFDVVKNEHHTYWDDRGNIGKRYLTQDEIGTPWCVTVDFDTLNDDTVTIRDRDSKEQERISIGKLIDYIDNKLNTS